MTPHDPAFKNVDHQQPLDERLPYEAPQLVDRGVVSELTQSNGNNNGADAAYS